MHEIKNLIIFDMDGTLVDSEKGYVLAWEKAFNDNNILVNSSTIESWSGLSVNDVKQKIFDIVGDKDLVERLRENRELEFFKLINDGIVKLKEGAQDLLEYLKESKVRMALATSSYQNRTERILEELGINHYFSYKAYGDSVKAPKPCPDIIFEILYQAKVCPSQSIIIEDSESGARAGISAGVKTVIIPDNSLRQNEFYLNYPNIEVFHSLKEIQENIIPDCQGGFKWKR